MMELLLVNASDESVVNAQTRDAQVLLFSFIFFLFFLFPFFFNAQTRDAQVQKF